MSIVENQFYAIASVLTCIAIFLWGLRCWLFLRVTAPSPKVFISYRRDDSRADSNALWRSLAGDFGESAVFLDTNTIEPGAEFPKEIDYRLRESDVVLVVIGPVWESIANDQRRPRIMAEDDWVRREVELAMEYAKHVIPVTLGTRAMPIESDLPAGLHPMLLRNATPLRSDRDFTTDVARIRRECCKYSRSTPETRYLIGSDVAALVAGLGLIWVTSVYAKQSSDRQMFDSDTIATERQEAIGNSEEQLRKEIRQTDKKNREDIEEQVEASKRVLPSSLTELHKALLSSEASGTAVLEKAEIIGAIATTTLTFNKLSNSGSWRFEETGVDDSPNINLYPPENSSPALDEAVKSKQPLRVRLQVIQWSGSSGFIGKIIYIVPAQN
ncbi:toll/interleukin-1 receptor domain-containing protein [Rhodopirellula sp. MGV]|uniref:toll/interleukin-1 receptor domain-containing protein n=1 Tax=Rhodopirellula sp. MGV TaxID=2023130 RepID=UPI000B961FC2|nr:toll/interleukin-1 receptor domain-containing protein [Rhodopirellula sp. MGV]OYP35368.1 hypothetical protein CGZ80_11910 [Rhodopirellula sp. MGV]PNY37744.1 TIR domain-containing protein [Rhodopirellula baltica]